MFRDFFHFIRMSLFVLIMFGALVVKAQEPQKLSNLSSPNSASYSKFLISVDGGLGYLIASAKAAKEQMKNYGISDQGADDYYRKLKLGEQAGASAYYFINPSYGLGLDYSWFTTNSSAMGYLDPGDGWTKFYGQIKEKMYTNFVGASVFQKVPINEKWNLCGKFSLGMAFYRDEARIVTVPQLITGSAFAVRLEYGFAYSLTRNISVNAGVSYLLSTLDKVQINNGTSSTEVKLEGESKENISRLNLSTGLQFHF